MYVYFQYVWSGCSRTNRAGALGAREAREGDTGAAGARAERQAQGGDHEERDAGTAESHGPALVGDSATVRGRRTCRTIR